MKIENKLARALGRNDERPNVELAESLCTGGAQALDEAVAELVELMGLSSKIPRRDAMKVLYEIGARRPEHIAPYVENFVMQLDSRDNRTVWSALSALDTIKYIAPDGLFEALDKIIRAADAGSVIAKDKTMSMLAHLASEPPYAEKVLPIVLCRLKKSATNQFPSYAEWIAPAVAPNKRQAFIRLLRTRHESIPHRAKKARIEKLIRQLSKNEVV